MTATNIFVSFKDEAHAHEFDWLFKPMNWELRALSYVVWGEDNIQHGAAWSYNVYARPKYMSKSIFKGDDND